MDASETSVIAAQERSHDAAMHTIERVGAKPSQPRLEALAEPRRVAAGVLFVGLVLVLAIASPVLGQCPCPPFSAADAVKSASLIFVGKAVTSVSIPGGRMERAPGGGWVSRDGPPGSNRVTFAVSLLVKGRAPRLVEVEVPDGTSCGVYFQVGLEYFVFASSRGGVLYTDPCGGSASGKLIASRAAEVGKVPHPR